MRELHIEIHFQVDSCALSDCLIDWSIVWFPRQKRTVLQLRRITSFLVGKDFKNVTEDIFFLLKYHCLVPRKTLRYKIVTYLWKLFLFCIELSGTQQIVCNGGPFFIEGRRFLHHLALPPLLKDYVYMVLVHFIYKHEVCGLYIHI